MGTDARKYFEISLSSLSLVLCFSLHSSVSSCLILTEEWRKTTMIVRWRAREACIHIYIIYKLLPHALTTLNNSHVIPFLALSPDMRILYSRTVHFFLLSLSSFKFYFYTRFTFILFAIVCRFLALWMLLWVFFYFYYVFNVHFSPCAMACRGIINVSFTYSFIIYLSFLVSQKFSN